MYRQTKMRVLYFWIALVYAGQLKVTINDDASWSLVGPKGFQLESGTYMLHRHGKYYHTYDHTLAVQMVIANKTGSDNLGAYIEHVFAFTTPDPDVKIHAYIRNYPVSQFLTMGQHFYPPWDGMSVGDNRDAISTSFPSIKVPETTETTYYFNPCGEHAGYADLRNGTWDQKNMTNMCDGRGGGPFFIFDKTDLQEEYRGQSFSISSYSEFMVHNAQLKNGTNMPHIKNEIWFGLAGTIDTLPSNGFDIQTIISYSDQGFFNGVQKWGNTLLTRYGKTTARRESDYTINYLNYWTDNGAYYYYNSESSDYEDTMINVANQDIPYKSWQFDSWWYYKDENGAVLNWTAMPSAFPNGIESVFQTTSIPLVAQNRWWSSQTNYALANGGDYVFEIDSTTSTAVPVEAEFWNDLFHNSTNWGLIGYEQDWLNIQTDNMGSFGTNVTMARDWLLQMGQGAENFDINIMYSTAWPRHMLQSVQIPTVTSIRVSNDYQPGNYQWDIGVSSIYSYALGLSPFKDVFWTTTIQPGNEKYGNNTEYRTTLQSVIATLSTGIVGIVGLTDNKILNKCIMPNGKVLKPSIPLVIPDFLLWTLDTKKYLNGTTEYETLCELSGKTFGIIMGFAEQNIDSTRSYYLENYRFQHDQKSDYKAVVKAQFGEGEPIIEHHRWTYDKPIDIDHFRNINKHEELVLMIYTAPIWKVGKHEVSFMGEVGPKWTNLSPQRFTDLDVDSVHVYADMNGVPGEVIELNYDLDNKSYFINCTVPASGKVSFNLEADNGNIFCQDA